MHTMTVGPEIEERLEALGAKTAESKEALLQRILVEALEELQDVRLAEAVLANPGKTYSLEEIEDELALDG